MTDPRYKTMQRQPTIQDHTPQPTVTVSLSYEVHEPQITRGTPSPHPLRRKGHVNRQQTRAERPYNKRIRLFRSFQSPKEA